MERLRISYPNSNALIGAAGSAMSFSPTGGSVSTITSYTLSSAGIVLLANLGLSFNATTGVISGTTTTQQSSAAFTVTANNSGGSQVISLTLTVLPLTPSAALSTITASSASVVADGTSTVTLTVTLRDQYSNLVSGKAVSVSSSRGGTDTITAVSATTNSSGVATFTAKSTTTGTSIFSASDVTDSVTITPSTASVSFTAGAATQISVSSGNNQTQTANASLTSPLVVLLQDANNNLVSGASVSWAITTGAGTLSTTTTATNASGLASLSGVTLTSTGANQVTATITLGSASVNFSVTTTSALASSSTSTISVSPNSLAAYGAMSTIQVATVTVTVKDSMSNPISGKLVALSSSSSNNIITNVSTTTNASGIATFQIQSSQPGTPTLSATVASDTMVVSSSSAVSFYQPTAVTAPNISTSLGTFTISTTTGGTYSVTNTGGAITSCSITPTPPSAVTFNTSNCAISSTASYPNALDSYTVRAFNQDYTNGTQSSVLSLLMGQNQLFFSGAFTLNSGIMSGSVCAASSSKMMCWGGNTYGQLGDGTTTNRSSAVSVQGLNSLTIAQIASYSNAVCVLFTNSTVQCWGYNLNGQLGNNSSGDSLIPVNVVNLSSGTITNIVSAENSSFCVLFSDSKVQCWGRGIYNQLGTNGDSSYPVTISGFQAGTITQLIGGYSHYCALFSNSTVQCWGKNDYGQLGDGTTTQRSTPVNVVGLQSGTITQILGSYSFSCALFSNSTVQCWGNNSSGQLGDGTQTDSLSPVSVAGLQSGTISQMSCSRFHCCALFTNSTVQCWGSNGYGQLGGGATVGILGPVTVLGLSSGVISQIAASYWGNCVLFSNNMVQCWGHNGSGQLGDNTTTSSLSPVNVIF